MPHLPSGTRLGPYETLALLGAGGMGEVYRARDTRLGRSVAIKVLPESFSQDAERVSRFLREAQILASLNHPHIAAIYGLEDWNKGHFLVLELVDGGTLAERIEAGPLPHEQAIAIARELADALKAAHEIGVVHRDLKPANIGFARDGNVKVLDFGLAKSVAPEPSAGHTHSPTIASDTVIGTILGTAAYLSPEQARGLAVDNRADIWAFGCVMFEMLAGKGPFGGTTTFDIVAKILQGEPEWSALPADTPVALRRLLRRCIEKDARRRLQDVADATLYLEDALEPAAQSAAPRAAAPPARNVEFRRLTDFSGAKESPAISPDGKMAAFVAVSGGWRQIWLRMIAGGPALQLTRDEADHAQPRWAPDSNTLIYYTPPRDGGEQGTIWEVAALGGWPRAVTSSVGGAAVSPDGRRLALLQLTGEQLALTTVARDGSDPLRIALLPSDFTYTSLRWSPDGRDIAFQRSSGSGFSEAIEIAAVSGGERREVVQGTTLIGFSWLPDGSGFVYSSSRGSTLLYPPVTNLRMVRRDGGGDRALTFGDSSYVHPDTHASGLLVATRIKRHSDIWRFPIGGPPAENTRGAVRVTQQTGHVQVPSVSPDGSEVVYISDNGGHANLWIAKTNGSGSRQITFEGDPDVAIGVPAWSPKKDLIAFLLIRSGRPMVATIRADGGGLRQVAHAWAPCWSADGQWLYLWRLDGTRTLEKVPVAGGAPVAVREEEDFIIPSIAPDGSSLYYAIPVHNELTGSWRPSAGEIRRAQPEDAPSEVLVRVAGDRIAGRFRPILSVSVSPDGRWLAIPLVDGVTTNLWGLLTSGGELTRFTDFGDRPVDIERNVSWSPDSQSLYAAVAEEEMDIVLFDGLLG